MKTVLPVLASCIAAAACSPRYAYVPVSNATSAVGGRLAADYPVPPDQPRGDLRIASFGLADLTPHGVPDDEEHALHAIHLRLVVANSSDAVWTLDTREQRLDLAGHGKSAPAFASADLGSPPPIVTISPGGKRVVDLFFPLPADEQKASKLPGFDAIWTVHTASQAVTERAPFDRIVESPVETEYDYGPDYWGPPYWYDPYYPGVAFIGVTPLAAAFIGPPLVIHVHGGFHRRWR